MFCRFKHVATSWRCANGSIKYKKCCHLHSHGACCKYGRYIFYPKFLDHVFPHFTSFMYIGFVLNVFVRAKQVSPLIT